MIKQNISHYNILEKLGEGGMGIVYKAEDTKLNRFVALKFLPHEFTENADAKQRFIREAQSASTLDHPNICTIYEINETPDGQMFISMAYYEGETLKQKLKNGPLLVHQAVDIAIQISQGLAKAHETGLIHRDLKPANILITKDGTAKIVDFGLAKLEGRTRLTKNFSTMGTIAYVSPEQVRGKETDQRTDIWAAGVILYEMLTGQLPFKGEYDQIVIYSILHEKPIKVTSISADIPSECENIIDKALQKAVLKRYQRMHQMEVDLKNVRQNLQIRDPKRKVPLSLKRKIKKHSVLIAIFMLLIAAFFIFKPLLDKKKIENPISITVISFENQTGTTAYDYLQDAIPNLLITSLEQSPYLQVTTWERMYDLLKQVGKENIKVIDKNTGFEICSLDGIDAIVSGSFVKAGNIFTTDIKVLDVITKNIIKSVQSQGTGIESILKHQIDELSKEISGALILPEKQIEYAHTNIMDVTTSSIDAYHYFVRGRDEYYRGTGDAEKYLKRAITMDTTFATAYLWLGRVFTPNIAERNNYLLKAKQYSNRATKKEQLYIEAELEPNYDRKNQLYQQIINQYPKEKYSHYLLGEHYAYHEKFEAAIDQCQQALKLDPNFVPATHALCYRYAETGDSQKADEYLKRLAAISPGDALPVIVVGNIYFTDGKLDEAIHKYNEASEIDPDAMSEVYASVAYALQEDFNQALISINDYIAIKYPPYREAGGRGWRCHLYYFTGQHKNALNDIEFAHGKFKEWNNLSFLALCEALLGSFYYEKEDYEKSRYHFKQYNEVMGGKDYFRKSDYIAFTCESLIGLVDIKQGYIDSAQIRLGRKDTLLPKVDVTLRDIARLHYQLLEAELLLTMDSTDTAIMLGEKIKELALPRYYFSPNRLIFYNLPWSRDILARAYIKKGNIDKAVTEYERLIHFDPAGKDRRIMNPKYHYYLARLYQQKEQKNKAVQHLEKFLEIWKNADEDISEFIDAKKRLKELTSNE
jgi:serine/threonine protein kinase/cytochrome c-type biogenesis protein CcmH/NrfG